MIDKSLLSIVGRFNKPHGIKGELSATLDVDDVAVGSTIFVELDGLTVPFRIEAVRPKSTENVLLTIKGITDENMASKLSLLPIYMEKSKIKEDEDEGEWFFLDDFIGFKIYDNNELVGEVTDYDDSTENTLFEVLLPSGTKVFVPANDDLIQNLDFDNKIISMNLPIGLIDL